MKQKLFALGLLLLIAAGAWADGITDGVYFLRNQDGRFLARGQEWGTRAIVDSVGLPINITTDATGTSTLQFIDTGKYLFHDESVTWHCWTDETDGSKTKTQWKFAALPNGTYHLSSVQQSAKCMKLDAGDNRLYTDGSVDSLFVCWTLIPYAEQAKNWNLDLKYKVGDITKNDVVNVEDLAHEVKALKGEEIRTHRHYVDDKEGVTPTDAATIGSIILGTDKYQDVDSTWTYAKAYWNFYPVQSGSAPTTHATCLLDGSDVSSHYSLDAMTVINVTTTLSNVESVSIYSLDKAKLTGSHMLYRQGNSEVSVDAAGTAGSVYVNGMQSDLVTVTKGSSGVYTAYLCPVDLPNGVYVTVKTTDGTYYSQTFTGLTAGAVNNLTFTSTTTNNNWMATLPGNLYVTQLSVPGAHDAATSGCSSYTYLSKCQEKSLSELLACGVRAFDLRPGYLYTSTLTADNLYIYHGQVSTGVKYTDAITTFVSFLQANPTEMISIIMSKENNKPTITLKSWTDYSDNLQSIISSCHSEYSDYMQLLNKANLTLSDYRGKICCVNRMLRTITNAANIKPWEDDSDDDDGIITDYSSKIYTDTSWGTSYYSANIEDAYNDEDSQKETDVKAMLDLASANTDSSHFHYTYTSIAGALSSSLTSHCSVLNPYTADYITNNVTGPVGYVYGDYMGSSSYSGATLVKAIIAQNYKYAYTGQSESK